MIHALRMSHWHPLRTHFLPLFLLFRCPNKFVTHPSQEEKKAQRESVVGEQRGEELAARISSLLLRQHVAIPYAHSIFPFFFSYFFFYLITCMYACKRARACLPEALRHPTDAPLWSELLFCNPHLFIQRRRRQLRVKKKEPNPLV